MNPKRVPIVIFFLALALISSIYLISNVEFKKQTITGKVIQIDTRNSPLPSEFDLTDKTIILYNQNYLPAKDLAEYYANARGISHDYLCPLKIRPQEYISGPELKEVRREIVENCICDILSKKNIAPSPCTVENIEAISNVSPISHMVSIKGMPYRLYKTNWTDENFENPPVDYYLSVYIYSSVDIFNTKIGDDSEIFTFNRGLKPYCGFSNETKWLQPMDYYYTLNADGTKNYSNFTLWYSTSMRSYVRAINISMDRKLAFGRVEAITPERTKELIDRTIEIENNGIEGNFVVSLTTPAGFAYPARNLADYRFLSELVSNNPSICDVYIGNNGLWNYSLCRAGGTLDGNIPGEPTSGIPLAYNIGLFLGGDYLPNGQTGFEGFYNMINWKVNDSSQCKIFCNDFASQPERDACKQNSKDYFKELNTECVGANPSLIGWQYRSFPVYFYGYSPKHWTYQKGDLDIKNDPSSYKDNYFKDDYYLRFGNVSDSTISTCINSTTNTQYSCPGYIFPYLSGGFYPPQTIYINSGVNITFSFQYRYPSSNVNKIWYPGIFVYLTNDSDTRYFGTRQYYLTKNSPNTWEKYEYNFTLDQTSTNLTGNVKMTKFDVSIHPATDNMVDWMDIDAVVLKDTTNNLSILKYYFGADSFNSTDHYQNDEGSYAFNAIDRLGGIGWWGSGSHHITWGHAYRDDTRFLGTFFAGRTLGESITYQGCYEEQSGFVYADPLYNPSGVKIYTKSRLINNKVPILNDIFENKYIPGQPKEPGNPYIFGTDENNSKESLMINAFNGKKRTQTHWTLSRCYNDKTDCIDFNSWEILAQGDGPAYALVLPLRFIDLIENKTENTELTLKLRVWNTGEENNDLSDYASLYYDSTNYVEEILPQEDTNSTENSENSFGGGSNNNFTYDYNVTSGQENNPNEYYNNNYSYNPIDNAGITDPNLDLDSPSQGNEKKGLFYFILYFVITLLIISILAVIYIIYKDPNFLNKDKKEKEDSSLLILERP